MPRRCGSPPATPACRTSSPPTLSPPAGAAAGVEPSTLGVAPGAPSLQDFLAAEYGSADWGDEPPQGLVSDYEQAILVAHAAGLDPARLSAVSNQPAQVAA